jgi:hypothetical protein
VSTLPAQGWYLDPYGIHQDRYFSAGTATKLVRDGRVEAYDPPPDRPLPSDDLIPADEGAEEARNGSDLRRAGNENFKPYDAAEARSTAVNIANRFPIP